MFGVSTRTVTERGDIWENQPTNFSECLFILESNGWTPENAFNALESLADNPGEDYLIVNEHCQIC